MLKLNRLLALRARVLINKLSKLANKISPTICIANEGKIQNTQKKFINLRLPSSSSKKKRFWFCFKPRMITNGISMLLWTEKLEKVFEAKY